MSALRDKKKLVLYASVSMLALAGILVIAFFLSHRSVVILLPADPVYSASWGPFLREAGIRLKVEKILIRTWSNQEELEKLLADAKKTRILFAEVPVDFQLKQLKKKGLIESIPRSLFEGKPYYAGYIQALKTLSGSDSLLAFPFSLDPWVTVAEKGEQIKKKAEALLTIPAKDDAGAIAAYGLAAGILGQASRSNDLIQLLGSLQDDHTFQHSAFTYNASDAFTFFMDKRAPYAFVSMSYFRTLPTEIVFGLEIARIPDIQKTKVANIVARGTVLVIPSSSGTSLKKTRELPGFSGFLSDREILHGVTKDRNTLPATTDTKVRDFHSENVRAIAIEAPVFIFPEALFDSDANRAELLEDIRFELVSR